MKNIPLLAHVAAFSIFIPAGAAIFFWKRLDAQMKVFAVLSIYSVLHLITEFIMGRYGMSNQTLSDVHQIIEFGCLSYLFYMKITEKYFRQTATTAVVFYVIFWTYNVFYYNDPDRFSELISMVASIILILMSVAVLTMLFQTTTTALTDNAIFWIAGGTIIYYSGTISIFTMSNTILAMGMKYFDLLWHFNWTLGIITNIIFARSFKCRTL